MKSLVYLKREHPVLFRLNVEKMWNYLIKKISSGKLLRRTKRLSCLSFRKIKILEDTIFLSRRNISLTIAGEMYDDKINRVRYKFLFLLFSFLLLTDSSDLLIIIIAHRASVVK